ncbi:MAG: hypothetical protein IPN50_13820 [Sphingomonadales bacterium]|nr:hypothetical protein [Sphingomonadales bacterium]
MITAPRMLTIAALAAFGLGSPLYAKAPAKADEDAIRAMIEKVYAGYMREIPEAPKTVATRPPMTRARRSMAMICQVPRLWMC